MIVTIRNLTNNSLSTDLGLLGPGQSSSKSLSPEETNKISTSMKNLVDRGIATISVAEDPSALDSLEGANVSDATSNEFTLIKGIDADPDGQAITIQGGTGSNNDGDVNINTDTFGNVTIGRGTTTITLAGEITANNFSGDSTGTNTGDLTLTAVGSSPNANGATIGVFSQELTLQPASGPANWGVGTVYPGVVSDTDQVMGGGLKTFTDGIKTRLITCDSTGFLDIQLPDAGSSSGPDMTITSGSTTSGFFGGQLLIMAGSGGSAGTGGYLRLNAGNGPTSSANHGIIQLGDLYAKQIELGRTGIHTYVKGGLQVEGDMLALTSFTDDSANTGNRTVNKLRGISAFAGSSSAITISNNLVTSTSTVLAVLQTNDATAQIKNVVPGSNTFTINLTANTTGVTKVSWVVIN
jgi:hypothetical protein